MTAIAVAWVAVMVILLVRSCLDIISLIKNIRWLDTQSKKVMPSEPSTRFIICIPALYEQSTIRTTLDKMLALQYPKNLYEIYVVTTSRELKQGKKSTTNELVKKYKNTLSKEDKQRIHVVNSPDKNGRMAHQINYAAQQALNQFKNKYSYFVIYNADSDVNPDTLKVANNTIKNIAKQKGEMPLLMQQSAVYSHTNAGGWIESSITKGAAMHQSRWTLVHELTKLRNQSRNVGRLAGTSIMNSLRYARVAHCVGHGLFVQAKYYLQNPLPTDTLNEDLPYGLMQTAKRNGIYPIPVLEIATSPARLTNLYNQKTVWFNPFFEFYTCARKLLISGEYVSKFEVYLLTTQAWLTMAIWLVHSFVWASGLVLSVIMGWEYALIWLLIFTIYWIAPSLLYAMFVRREGLYSCFSLKSLILGSFYVLTHSVGPVICCYRWIKASITGVQIDKPKTVNN